MEYSLENIHSFQIYVRTSPDATSPLGYGFVHEGKNRHIEPFPQDDFYIPVFITQTGNLMEYVDISHDDSVFTIQRQEVNPYFIEFSFFDSIKRNKVNEGADLTQIMLNYIRFVRPDVAGLNDSDLKTWFDTIGRYELPWNKGQANETDLDTLDKISLVVQNIISKANFLNIDINK
jgi:hypothetical protein